jgi:hypothetical protein
MTLPDAAVLAAAIARSQVVARAYRTGDAWTRAVAAFAGCGRAMEVAAAAQALFADGDWLAAAIAPLVRALADDPWFDPPFRVRREAGRIGAVLFESETAAITGSVLQAGLPAPTCVVVPGRLSVVRFVAGRGRVRL